MEDIYSLDISDPTLMRSIVGNSFDYVYVRIENELMMKEDLAVFCALCNECAFLERMYSHNKYSIKAIDNKIGIIHYIHTLKLYEIIRSALRAVFSGDYIVSSVLRRTLIETVAMSHYLALNQDCIDDYILYSLVTDPEGTSDFFERNGIEVTKTKIDKLSKKFGIRRIMSVFKDGDDNEYRINTDASYGYLSQASHPNLNISDISYQGGNPPIKKFTYVNTINEMSKLLTDILFVDEVIAGGVISDKELLHDSRRKREQSYALHRARTEFFRNNPIKKDVYNGDIRLGVYKNRAIITCFIDKGFAT